MWRTWLACGFEIMGDRGEGQSSVRGRQVGGWYVLRNLSKDSRRSIGAFLPSLSPGC